MKRIALKMFMITVLSGIAFSLFAAPAAKQAIEVKITSVKLADVSEPKASFTSSLPIPQINKTNHNKWMMVLVEFTAGLEKSDAKKTRSEVKINSLETRNWLDNVEIAVKAICETVDAKEQKTHVLFSGMTKLWSLRLDGSRHLVAFFLPPHMLDRYYVPHSAADSNLKVKNAVKNFKYHKLNARDLMVEVVINADGGELAREYLNVKFDKKSGQKVVKFKDKDQRKEAEKKEFSQRVSKVPGMYNLDGAILSKGQSPWAYYKYDQFDLEKSTR